MRNKYELLNTEETPQQPEPEFIQNKWKSTKTCLIEALKTSLPKKTKSVQCHKILIAKLTIW